MSKFLIEKNGDIPANQATHDSIPEYMTKYVISAAYWALNMSAIYIGNKHKAHLVLISTSIDAFD